MAPTFRYIAALALPLALAVSGCAGTAQGQKTSAYRQPVAKAPTEFTAETSKSSALVVIRYPALIHADAETIYVSSFASKAIGGEVPLSIHSNPQTSRTAHGVISKSSYFAMSLYRELRDALPEGKVLLSPHIIEWSEQRGFHSRPILASEQIPSVLTIDFNIYSYPDVTEMMESPPVTFGDLITPMMVVKTSSWGQPALNGLLISSAPLMGTAWRQSTAQVREESNARYAGRTPTDSRPLAFIEFLNERNERSPSLPVTAAGGTEGSRLLIEQYPIEKIQMEGALIATLDTQEGQAQVANDPFSRQFAGGAADRIVRLLEQIDHARATFFARQAAIARFDPELANVMFARPEDESVRARMQLAEGLIGAEREFLAAQSDSVYAGSFEGDYGERMRKIIAAEYRMLEERRRLAKIQNVTSTVAAIALAGSVYAATVTTTASASAVAAFSGVSLMGSVWALNRALDSKAESEEVNEYFVARMAHASERQMSVQMEWLESKELITARGFAEFRNKTLTLYQSRVRSMAVAVDQRCTFEHPGTTQAGIWVGDCREGKAQGTGYGLILGDSSSVIEYLGEARNGMADGRGAMIVRESGATYFDGQFEKGRPDGIVRVEQAGSPPRTRRFKAGSDTGRGDDSQWQALSWR